jgi:hypothetical protein
MRLVSLLLFALLALGACASPLTRVRDQFIDGHYPEAKQILVSLEAESRTWNDAKRAEYALYRGLTHAALGDRDQAGVWLREARAIDDAHPGSLSREDAQRLKAGMESSDLP